MMTMAARRMTAMMTATPTLMGAPYPHRPRARQGRVAAPGPSSGLRRYRGTPPIGAGMRCLRRTESPHAGESFVEVIGRVSAAIRRLVAAHPGRDIIAVAHGGTIRAALALALGLDPEAALAFMIENCSITRLDHIEGPGMGHGWRVVAVNRPPR